MHVAIAYLLTALFISVTFFTLGGDVLNTFGDITDAWTTVQARSEQRADTKVTGPIGLSMEATSTVKITLTNEGKVPLDLFSDWDVIFEIQTDPGLGLDYLTYTTSTSPATSEWTVQEIYLNAASSTPEIVDPGILNPGEDMVVLANPSPSVVADTEPRVTFVTPNGVTTKVMFEVLAPNLYVVDATDTRVYKYLTNGTYLSSSPLDTLNGDARGIATDDTNFWAVDIVDDVVYKYTLSFSLVDNWAPDAANHDGTGVTTDGSNIWTVDIEVNQVF